MGHRDDLAGSLHSAEASQRRQAIADLAKREDHEAVRALTDALLGSHWPLCGELADALAQIGTDEARQGLMRALKGRRHHIRSAAVNALAQLGGKGTREAIAALKDDPSYEVRQDVEQALVESEG